MEGVIKLSVRDKQHIRKSEDYDRAAVDFLRSGHVHDAFAAELAAEEELAMVGIDLTDEDLVAIAEANGVGFARSAGKIISICMICGVVIAEKDGLGVTALSHGYCKQHGDEVLSALEARHDADRN